MLVNLIGYQYQNLSKDFIHKHIKKLSKFQLNYNENLSFTVKVFNKQIPELTELSVNASLEKQNVIKNKQECVVCFDITNYVTSCNHILCYTCAEKITNRKCPYC